MDLITNDSNTLQVLIASLDRILKNVEYIVTHCRPPLNGEHYLTGEEVCKRLCISKRTLQGYRDTGLLGYIQLPGKGHIGFTGKTLSEQFFGIPFSGSIIKIRLSFFEQDGSRIYYYYTKRCFSTSCISFNMV